MSQTIERFQSFSAFYPYYLAEHRNPTCRRLHYLGTTMMLMLLVGAILAGRIRF
jgi:hypothetical protein